MNWDIQHTLLNSDKVEFIDNARQRNLVLYFLDQFKCFALPHLFRLRHQIIHNDLNDWNVLCSENKIFGIIDFGDVAHTALINELAIALTYVMMGNRLPIAAASEVIKGYCSKLQLTSAEISLIPYLIPARLCISVCNSAESKSQNTDTQYITISEQAAWNLLERWVSWNPQFLKNSFLKAAGFLENQRRDANIRMSTKREKYFSKAQGLTYSSPIHMSGAAFQYMYDNDGNAYLDAYNNIPLVGHCHPKINSAVSQQARKLNTNTRYHNESLYRYAEKLLSCFPDYLNKVFFVNSGTEANELAQRLAKTYTGNSRQIVMEMGYHGHTERLIELSSYKYNGAGGLGKSHEVLELPLPKLYRGKNKHASDYLAEAKTMINTSLERGVNYSSFLFEPISGCGGQVPIAKGYLRNLVQFLQEKEVVCISDEVQTGFGRLGRWFWGFEMHDLCPDIVVLGKPMGNGFPIGAVVTTEKICQSFENGMEFFSSFGGNPLSTEAANALLNVLEEEKLPKMASMTGDYLKSLLFDLQKLYPVIGDVRGEGLFLGIEFTNSEGFPFGEMSQYIKEKLKENYILTSTDGRFNETLKIKPPLCFNKKNAEYLVECIETALK